MYMERKLKAIICSPQGGKLSLLNPTCGIGKTILGGICVELSGEPEQAAAGVSNHWNSDI